MQMLRSVQRALDLVEERLSEAVSIEELAQVAGMSLWHFQRCFSALVGEPAGRYIRRRRIGEAAKLLRDYEGRLLDLALDFQFESHEAFTRAFKAELSVTPSEYRNGGGEGIVLRLPEFLTKEALELRYMNMDLTPVFEYRYPASFVGFEGSFISAQSEEANNMAIIPKLWDAFAARLDEIPTCEPGVSYGLAHDPEAHGREREHEDDTLYLAAARVKPGCKVPLGMKLWESPGGLFAKFEHHGPAQTIGKSMAYIYGKWLPESDYELAEGPEIERIDDRFIPYSDKSVLDIFIPVKSPLE